nr:flagellar biosynthesis regulator FlaF [Neorhizobium tomejilense]
MLHYAYADVMQDSVADAKINERQAFDRSLELMARAQKKGVFGRDTIEAVTYTRQLWSILLDDLASAENQLTTELKAGLISIGLWIYEQADKIMNRRSHDFRAMIEVTGSIRAGLN